MLNCYPNNLVGELSRHPSLAEELNQVEELNRHPSLAEALNRHPSLAEALNQHPSQRPPRLPVKAAEPRRLQGKVVAVVEPILWAVPRACRTMVTPRAWPTMAPTKLQLATDPLLRALWCMTLAFVAPVCCFADTAS